MADHCSTCGVQVVSETAPILFINTKAEAVYVCEECEKKIDTILSDESISEEEKNSLFAELIDGVEQGVELYLRNIFFGDDDAEQDDLSKAESICNEIYLVDEDEKFSDEEIKHMVDVYLNLNDYEAEQIKKCEEFFTELKMEEYAKKVSEAL